MIRYTQLNVIPAEAGTQVTAKKTTLSMIAIVGRKRRGRANTRAFPRSNVHWIPASAGMTVVGVLMDQFIAPAV